MDFYDIALAKQLGGGGSSVTIEELNVTANGTYSAPTGKAYSPVNVNVSGGGDDLLLQTLNRTISGTYTGDSTVLSIPAEFFKNCNSLNGVSFPSCQSIYSSAFEGCTYLYSVSFPICSYTGSGAFKTCTRLENIYFPELSGIPIETFRSCSAASWASFPKVKSISKSAFIGCISLESLYLMNSVVATLSTSVFNATPMSLSSYLGYFGSIYVPASLLASYQSATNWAEFSDRLVGV